MKNIGLLEVTPFDKSRPPTPLNYPNPGIYTFKNDASVYYWDGSVGKPLALQADIPTRAFSYSSFFVDQGPTAFTAYIPELGAWDVLSGTNGEINRSELYTTVANNFVCRGREDVVGVERFVKYVVANRTAARVTGNVFVGLATPSGSSLNGYAYGIESTAGGGANIVLRKYVNGTPTVLATQATDFFIWQGGGTQDTDDVTTYNGGGELGLRATFSATSVTLQCYTNGNASGSAVVDSASPILGASRLFLQIDNNAATVSTGLHIYNLGLYNAFNQFINLQAIGDSILSDAFTGSSLRDRKSIIPQVERKSLGLYRTGYRCIAGRYLNDVGTPANGINQDANRDGNISTVLNKRNILIVEAGTNDLLRGDTGAVILTQMNACIASRKTAGWPEVWAMTCQSAGSGGYEDRKLDYNTLLKGSPNAQMSGVIDISASAMWDNQNLLNNAGSGIYPPYRPIASEGGGYFLHPSYPLGYENYAQQIYNTILKSDSALSAGISLSSLLTGLAAGTNAVIAATDSLLTAFAKLQAQVTDRASKTIANTFSLVQTFTLGFISSGSATFNGAIVYGSRQVTATSVAVNATATVVICNNGATAITLTMPALSAGRKFQVIRGAGSSAAITMNAGTAIMTSTASTTNAFAVTDVIPALGGANLTDNISRSYLCDGTNWFNCQ